MVLHLSKNFAYLSYSRQCRPVGNYGKGVLSVFNRLSLNGCDVEMKIYENARHELVNETNRREVYNDIADFLLDIISSEMCSD